VRRRAAGLTLVEIMVSVALVGVACALALGAQVRLSRAFQDQRVTAQTQQTLVSAASAIVGDVQMAGYLASSVQRAGQTAPILPITVVNGGAAPDQLTVLYADASQMKVIPQTGNDSATYRSQTGTLVASTRGLAAGQLLLATHIASNGPPNAPSVLGIGCLLKATSVTADHIITDPATTDPWTDAQNAQCDGLAAVWNDGYTAFAVPVFRSYRVKPDDPRGVLQRSPSGGVLGNDWQDVAMGVVDLQVALRVFVAGDTVDEDGDGLPELDWYSSDNMNALPTGAIVTEVAVTLLAKSAAEVTGAVLDRTPDLREADRDAAYNRVGDVAGTTLPVTAPDSPYFGSHIFRTYTARVNLRNSANVH
jgi:type II secretory pathway pseudopilin PulG